MKLRASLLTCTLSVLIPFGALAAETGAGPRFEVERDWSGELRPRYQGPTPQDVTPSPLPAPIPQAVPKVEAPAPVKPRAQARMRITTEPPARRNDQRGPDTFAWEGPEWEADDRRTGPDRAWSERERREREWQEREYAEREYAERVWQEEERLARAWRERVRDRRERRYDVRDEEEEMYWDDCDRYRDRC